MSNLVVIEKTSLVEYRQGLVFEQEAAVRIAEEILTAAEKKGLPAPKYCIDTKIRGEARLKALRAGFLPTVGLRTRPIPKLPLRKKREVYDWALRRQRQILATVKALPYQAQEAIAEAQSLEIFDKISISIPGGDPVVVGHAGGWKFLIASWVYLMDGQGVGFRFRLSNPGK
jgi:hypothetical protein